VDAIFGKSKTPKERMKEYQRSIKRTVRDLDRERNGLERQEKKLMGDIKKAAKDGQVDAAKVMARDLVRTRGYIKKMSKMKSHMEAISLRLTTMSSSQQMAETMKKVGKVMGKMNKQMNIPQLSLIMQKFEKENEMMGMKEEMMDDAMDDAFAEDGDEEEEEQVLGAVLAELGVELGNKISETPTAAVESTAGHAQEGGAVAAAGGGGADDSALDKELQERLNNLRRT